MASMGQKTVKMSAVKANDYGVSYILPQTAIKVYITVKKTTQTPGELYQYSERYLSIKNPITTQSTVYSIENITTHTIGIPNKNNAYLVEFRSNTQAPFVTLSEEGLIYAINSDASIEEQPAPPSPPDNSEEELPHPRTFLTEEILSSGSTAKEAELIARQIYKLRETRNDILTGEAENMPPDGEAYRLVLKNIELQEKALMQLFVGKTKEEYHIKEFTIIPTTENISGDILCRFSIHLGIVSKNDLAGSPIYLSLTNNNTTPKPQLTPKEEKALADKLSKGIVYNIPEKAQLTISYNGKDFINHQVDIVQFGTQEVLTNKMFDNNKQPIRVLFHPHIGAIKQIIQ